jgi:hypothetical protein
MSAAKKNDLVNELKQMGAKAMETGELEASRVVFESLLRHSPADLEVSSTLGLVLLRLHEFERARTVLTRARRMHPTSWQNHYNSGLLALDEMKAGRIAKLEAEHGGAEAEHGGAEVGQAAAGQERSKGAVSGQGVRIRSLSPSIEAPPAPSAPSAQAREHAIFEAIGHFNNAVEITRSADVSRGAELLVQAARQWSSPPEPLLQPPLRKKLKIVPKTTTPLELKTKANSLAQPTVKLETAPKRMLLSSKRKPSIQLGHPAPATTAAAAVQVDGSVQHVPQPVVELATKRPAIKAAPLRASAPVKVAQKTISPVPRFKVHVEVDGKLQELSYRLDDATDAATTAQRFCDTHNLATKYCHVLYHSLVQQFENDQGNAASADAATADAASADAASLSISATARAAAELGTSRTHLSAPLRDGVYNYGEKIPIEIKDLPSAQGFVSTEGEQLAILADDEGVIWSGQASETGLFMNAGITPGPHSLRLVVVQGPLQMSLLHAVFFTVELVPMLEVEVVGGSTVVEGSVQRLVVHSTPVELKLTLVHFDPSLLRLCVFIDDLHVMCLPPHHFAAIDQQGSKGQSIALQIPPEQMSVGAHRVRLMLVEINILRAFVYKTIEVAIVPPRAAAAGVYPPLRPPFPRTPASAAVMKDVLVSLGAHEYSRYSQNGEDGVLAALFTMIGVLEGSSGFYVEFGVEDGLECNSRLLREERGWDGLLMDGANSNATMGLHTEW